MSTQPTGLTIDASSVAAIFVAGSWLDVRGFRFVALDLGSGPLPGFEAFARQTEAFIYGKASDVTAIRTGRRIVSAEDLAAAQAEQAAEAAATFLRHHRTDEVTFNRAMSKQGGNCGSCGAPLAGDGRVHYDGKKLLGSCCSAFEHRF